MRDAPAHQRTSPLHAHRDTFVWFISSVHWQSHAFGSSPFLQASDYEADAELYGFADTYALTSNALVLPLNADAVEMLSTTETNQFRVTLFPEQFSNYNGSWCSVCIVFVVHICDSSYFSTAVFARTPAPCDRQVRTVRRTALSTYPSTAAQRR